MNPQTTAHPPCDSDLLATLCKAGGDPLRLKVLRALSNDSFGVLELAQIFAIGQSSMSHHLKVLAQAGLVATRREGNAIFYRRALAHSSRADSLLHAALLEAAAGLSLPTAVAQRITAVHNQRAAASSEFFTRIAANFQQQDLIASLAQYRDSLRALLDAQGYPASARALEVGPGDGSFLPELAWRFQRVTALDNCPAMLELARQRCASEGLTNVELQLGDALDDAKESADCVVLNMVLHHLAAPAAAMQSLAQRVSPGGSLLITELCSHNQNWVREACGDLWLGFEQDDLTRWASQAGLQPAESLYLGLRNGFQIQLRQFIQPPTPTAMGHSHPNSRNP